MTKRLLLTASTLALAAASTFTHAVTGERYTQDFSGFADQTDRGSWGLVDFTPGQPDLSPSNKAAYTTENNEILLKVGWNWATLGRMLGEETFNTLKNQIGARRVAALVYEQCQPKIEVGTQGTYRYGAPSVGGYVAETDSDVYHCNQSSPKITVNNVDYPISYPQKASAVNFHTYIPTTPGSKYTLTIKYHKRIYDFNRAGVTAEKAYGPLVVVIHAKNRSAHIEGYGDVPNTRVRIDLPTNISVADEYQEDGFNVANISFTANNFYTRVAMSDWGNPDSYGVLLNEISTQVTEVNPLKEMCELFYPPLSRSLYSCLNSSSSDNITPDLLSCNLRVDESINNFTVEKAGERSENQLWRYDPNNLFSTDNFYSVGKGGVSTLTLANNGRYAGCPIFGKTLNLEEYTGNNWDYERYAEQGFVEVKMSCLDENDIKSEHWEFVETQRPDNLLITSQKISKRFDDEVYQSCLLTAIRFTDRTHLIPEDQSGYAAKSDGYDIRNVRIEN